MRILFAAPERDLLSAYQKLLSGPELETETAFDGTQVLLRLSEKHFDLLVLSEDIPRIGWREILKYCREEQPIRLILMASESPSRYGGKDKPDGILSLPFEPQELQNLIESVVES